MGLSLQRESRASLRTDRDEEPVIDDGDRIKGKPFKRTVLKKILKLIRRPSDEHVIAAELPGGRRTEDRRMTEGRMTDDDKIRYGSHQKFIPGIGSTTFYQGASVRDPHSELDIKSFPSIQNIFTKKTKKISSFMSRKSSRGSRMSDGTGYSHNDSWKHGYYKLTEQRKNWGLARDSFR
ncbi:hypothetical protein TNIN_95951 [Trichonephila inaurata madagascariensis]|uniref:Uncharacterized protein n=1 Tax=Trichonephila inaurata madagascariensis TaxID=2747483 RepID=A0A8X7CNA0_9ARAC|nr:hypothetical protein TNIN_95951 [Trichonephila inaurata madagascariensis]